MLAHSHGVGHPELLSESGNYPGLRVTVRRGAGPSVSGSGSDRDSNQVDHRRSLVQRPAVFSWPGAGTALTGPDHQERHRVFQ
eukprot:722522-Hanusia_phi.AAC.1